MLPALGRGKITKKIFCSQMDIKKCQLQLAGGLRCSAMTEDGVFLFLSRKMGVTDRYTTKWYPSGESESALHCNPAALHCNPAAQQCKLLPSSRSEYCRTHTCDIQFRNLD